MTTKILVAVSARTAECVLANALVASRTDGAPIALLHVVDTPNCFVGAADFDCGLVMEAIEAQGRRVVSLAEQWFAVRGCAVEAHTLMLPPYGRTVGRAIAAFADVIGAQQIVLGSRHADGWQWFRDDIAADIVRHTAASVRRVRDDAPADAPLPAARQHARAHAARRA